MVEKEGGLWSQKDQEITGKSTESTNLSSQNTKEIEPTTKETVELSHIHDSCVAWFLWDSFFFKYILF